MFAKIRWGLRGDFGEHAFAKKAYLAGADEQRLADFNAAQRDPDVRAIFTTRGGKGSYRIADRLDFEAVRRDPKFIIGFSDITILHLNLSKHCGLVGIHGALVDDDKIISDENSASLRNALMIFEMITIQSRTDENTFDFTTKGNRDMISTAAGWALPDLNGSILLLECKFRGNPPS